MPGVSLVAPVEANLLFVSLPAPVIDDLVAAGVRLGRRGGNVVRLVTRFDGTDEEVDRLIELAGRATRAHAGG
jgi:threonine aldolase